ncbi:MAG: hypothetical protein A3G59_02180 [Candidatus Taylorbacteria bacterium RIFCSPLOWO2_12_FULL_47_20]|uniref:Peptidase M50 domain-containing protein n=2 Tax=Candidatus Tayloriibacteriota TaxID=1817919 RepID=A0A1G2P9T3_9BACT|nr:MAG: hypothetical protein A3H68_03745 [Candidatus Taylorbacteria bacterium RIFCSPLOWO2_02_FULL_46_40]OHA44489.1 MAG: hypothetical protein A3G59_02180 [Candidatus Taylorbacteria bacterium RIFCSPLOWO2_12_FULL_47_20]
MDTIFSIIILVMSVVVHEVSHGYAALRLGDQTARLAGRLTLNPIKHLDPVGSVIVPLLTTLGGFPFGWAKPIPYNPYNLRNQRWGELIVAAAGPVSNIIVAVFFSMIIRFSDVGQSQMISPFFEISATIVWVNLVLAIFNLLPVPPLDGSKILFSILPYGISQKIRLSLERYGIFIVVIFLIFIWEIVSPLIFGIFALLTGAGLQ